MSETDALRQHLSRLLAGGKAYETFEEVVSTFSPDLRGVVPPGAGHSGWEILEHLRIAQRDILDFSRNEDGSYVKKNWPDDYWPSTTEPPDGGAWDASVQAFLADRTDLDALARDRARELFTPFPWGTDQTLLREILLAADHTSYHLGQLVLLRRLLGP